MKEVKIPLPGAVTCRSSDAWGAKDRTDEYETKCGWLLALISQERLWSRYDHLVGSSILRVIDWQGLHNDSADTLAHTMESSQLLIISF